MTLSRPPTVEQCWQGLAPHFRSYLPEEQEAAVALYRELAKGQPVEAEQLASSLRRSPDGCRALFAQDPLKAALYRGDDGRIVGFGGLAVRPMHHRFTVGAQKLSTWCAWDTLFLPEILGATAHIESPDPQSGEPVDLVVTPERIEAVEPATAVLSFLLPEDRLFGSSATNVMAKFCHFVFFFASRESGEEWTASNPGTFLLTIADGFALARRANARNFGAALARQAA